MKIPNNKDIEKANADLQAISEQDYKNAIIAELKSENKHLKWSLGLTFLWIIFLTFFIIIKI